MLILGTSPDNTGAQLEQITRRLLEQQGYVNIATNSIGTGGLEIDVRADYNVPIPGGGNQVTRLIAECKAYRNPVAITDWLKFLGKIFNEEAIQNQDVIGLFVALSGVNGNVSGNYDILQGLRPRVRLLQGDALAALVRQVYNAISAAEIITRLGQLTSRRHVSVEQVYYANTVYWLVSFGNVEFTLLSATGELLGAEVLQLINPLVQDRTEHTVFVDLQAEEVAQERIAQLHKKILTSLMTAPKAAAGFGADVQGYNDQEIADALQLLAERGWIQNAEGLYRIVPQDIQNFYGVFREIVLFVLRGRSEVACIERMMTSPFVNQALVAAFIDEVVTIQAGLLLSASDRETVMQIVRLSPSALAYSLTPEALIVRHRAENPQNVPEYMEAQDAATLVRNLFDALERDFSSSHFSHYFYTLRGLREIETRKTVAVKSGAQIVLEREVGFRHGIGMAADELGGGYVHILLLDNAPQPWEPGGIGVAAEQPPQVDPAQG